MSKSSIILNEKKKPGKENEKEKTREKIEKKRILEIKERRSDWREGEIKKEGGNKEKKILESM